MSDNKEKLERIVICDNVNKFSPIVIEQAMKEVFGEKCGIQLYLYFLEDGKLIWYMLDKNEWNREKELDVQSFAQFILAGPKTLICMDYKWEEYPNFKEDTIATFKSQANYHNAKDKVKMIVYTTNSPGDADNYVKENKENGILLDYDHAFQMTSTLVKLKFMWKAIFKKVQEKF